jgi:hypothetical protein
MGSDSIAAIVLGLAFGGAMLGMKLRRVLPDDHLSSDSKDVVKLAMGLVATMAALVLGLLTGSAKSTFDTLDGELKQTSVNVIILDHSLAHYGPETKDIRDLIRAALVSRLATIWPEEVSDLARTPKLPGDIEGLEDRIRGLAPQNDAQRALRARALQSAAEVLRTRWLMFGGGGNSVQTPLLIVLTFWLTALFASFGVLAPRNMTVIVVLFVAAMSVSGSVFLILEMNQPMQGLLKVSSAPLRYALEHIDQ